MNRLDSTTRTRSFGDQLLVIFAEHLDDGMDKAIVEASKYEAFDGMDPLARAHTVLRAVAAPVVNVVVRVTATVLITPEAPSVTQRPQLIKTIEHPFYEGAFAQAVDYWITLLTQPDLLVH
jgi:hypothetical protein